MLHKKTMRMAGLLAVTVALAGCASMAARDWNAEALEVMKGSFRTRSIATVDRLNQDAVQSTCSQYAGQPVPKPVAEKLEAGELARVRYPADGKFLGDWKAGEVIAQSGRGLQFSDDEKTIAGGNCYACHRLSKEEISYGNLGPSLYQYGKLRGDSEAIVRYTWGKLWNSHAYNACSNMPRFGEKGILTEKQLKDVMALLLDPKSPVNQ